MRIVVFGSTGKTGVHLLTQGLAKGHDMTAYVRDSRRLPALEREARVVTGEVDDETSISRALENADCVISALGSGNGTLTKFAKTIVPAMEARGPRRLISLVGAGVAEPGDPSSLGRTVMLTLMKVLAAGVIKDATDHANILRDSKLDWTLVRPPRLVNGTPTGKVVHAPTLKLGPSASITRADLAAFMLEIAELGTYAKRSPMVANVGLR